MQCQTLTDQIWLIHNFLSPQECENLIVFSEQKGFEEAKVSLSTGAKMIKGIRNNDRLIYNDPILAQQFWKKLCSFCPQQLDNAQAIGLNECFRFYRYDQGQRFKKHLDGRFKRNETEESRLTFMIYLNDDFKGGETQFEAATIRPKTGMALCFVHEQKHESLPITEGTKYALRSDVLYKIL